jgi:hypothetical protein
MVGGPAYRFGTPLKLQARLNKYKYVCVVKKKAHPAIPSYLFRSDSWIIVFFSFSFPLWHSSAQLTLCTSSSPLCFCIWLRVWGVQAWLAEAWLRSPMPPSITVQLCNVQNCRYNEPGIIAHWLRSSIVRSWWKADCPPCEQGQHALPRSRGKHVAMLVTPQCSSCF